MFSKSLLKTDAYKLDTLASSFGFLKNIQRNWHTVFDNYKNALKEDNTQKTLIVFGLKCDASVSSGIIRSIGCAVNLFFLHSQVNSFSL